MDKFAYDTNRPSKFANILNLFFSTKQICEKRAFTVQIFNEWQDYYLLTLIRSKSKLYDPDKVNSRFKLGFEYNKA